MRRTLVLALLLAVISLVAGMVVLNATFPSDEDIQRVTIEEMTEGNPLLRDLFESPLISGLLDQLMGEMQSRVQDRVLEESRDAQLLGAGTTVLLMVIGVCLIAADHRRRHDGAAPPSASPGAGGTPAPVPAPVPAAPPPPAAVAQPVPASAPPPPPVSTWTPPPEG